MFIAVCPSSCYHIANTCSAYCMSTFPTFTINQCATCMSSTYYQMCSVCFPGLPQYNTFQFPF